MRWWNRKSDQERGQGEEAGPSHPPPISHRPSEPPPQRPSEQVDPEAETLAISSREPPTEPDPAEQAAPSTPPPSRPSPRPEPVRETPKSAPDLSQLAGATDDELPKPPTIGQVAQSWRRRLAETGWPRPSYAADGGELGGLEIRAASVVGQGHLHRGIQRQDAYHFAPAGRGVVVAVADGVSQMPLSAAGAEVAAFFAVRAYAERCSVIASAPPAERPGPAELLADSVDDAEAEVRRIAAELSIAPRELSTTLLVAALELELSGEVGVTIAAIGNSSAFEVVPEELPKVLSGPGAEEPSSAFGEFLPGNPGTARIDGARLRPGAALLLATDGLAEDFVNSASVRRWLWERVDKSRTPLEFAHALSYRRQGSMDDLTALAVRAPRRS